MTRDSRVWWYVIAGAFITALSSRMDLLDPLLPAQHTDKVHAVIELLSYLVGATAGVMRMSPLDISDTGREKAIIKDERKAADRIDAA